MRAESAWARDERVNERDKPEPKSLTTSWMYDAHGEIKSDEWWDKLEVANCDQEE